MPTELKLTPIKESLTPLQKIAFTAILKKVFKLCDITKKRKTYKVNYWFICSIIFSQRSQCFGRAVCIVRSRNASDVY